MNPYIEKLKGYLQNSNEKLETGGGILELLCYYYTEEHPLDTAVIRERMRQVDAILSRLSLEDNDAVFNLTVQICDEYIKQAFLIGARTGAQLILELQQSE